MPDFEPKDPNFDARVRASFARNRLLGSFGVAIKEITPGHVVMTLPFREDLCQQHGYLHGGVLAALLDSASGYAGLTLMPVSAAILGVEFKVNFVAPAIGERVDVFGRVLKSGRTLTVCAGDAYAISDGKQKLVASMLNTVIAVTDRDISD
jgi:uncharacterized protein (TIGR00369 family)